MSTSQKVSDLSAISCQVSALDIKWSLFISNCLSCVFFRTLLSFQTSSLAAGPSFSQFFSQLGSSCFCLDLSTIDSVFQYLSQFFNFQLLSQYISICLSNCLGSSTDVSACQLLSQFVSFYLSLSASVSVFHLLSQFLSRFVKQSLSLSASVSTCQLLSQFISSSLSLSASVSVSIEFENGKNLTAVKSMVLN